MVSKEFQNDSPEDYFELVNQCLGKSVKYYTLAGRHLSDYYDIKGAIITIGALSVHYERLIANFRNSPNLDANELLLINSVVVNIVMSYSKCFDISRNSKEKDSRRLIKLDRSIFKNGNKDILETHDLLLNLRNKLIAHATESEFEQYELRVGIDMQGYVVVVEGVDNRRLATHSCVGIDKLKPVLDELSKEVDKKIHKLKVKVEKELEILGDSRSYFLNKILLQQPITDEDLK